MKSNGIEYAMIVAAVAATFSVPVFANSLVTLAEADDDTTTTYQSPTVRSLGTLSQSDAQNQMPAPMPGAPPQGWPAQGMQPQTGLPSQGIPPVAKLPPVIDTNAMPKMVNTEQPADVPLQPVQLNGITYITGGIGDEERAELDSVKPNYNLHIVSAGRDGEYFGNTHIVIHDRKGNELLNVAAGPIFYAELPANSYTVEARSEGQSQKQSVNVGQHKSSFLHFTWH